jgi:hypothetical protein
MSESAPRPTADDEWADLLRQLRQQSPGQPQPYFYSRVQARLAAETDRAWWPGWVRRPAYALLLGALVLALSGDDSALVPGPVPPAASAPASP